MTPRSALAQRAAHLLPRRLSAWGAEPGVRRISGVILFADIAGFTAMTERARRRGGARGIEQLTTRLNGIFTALLAPVHQARGDVLKFGGDALLVAFADDGSNDAALARAIWCADRLHRTIQRERRRSGGGLALHLGMASGEWDEIVTGRPGERREHFIHGACIRYALDAAATAESGTCRLIARRCELPCDLPVEWLPIGPRNWRLEFPRMAWNGTVDDPGEYLHPDEGLLDYLPHQLRQQLEETGFDPLSSGEHRCVTTKFVFWRPPARTAGAIDLWQKVSAAVCEAADSAGGVWARSDPGDRYQKVLILFGALTSADDDADRALACAAALRDRLARLGTGSERVRFGIGITTATVFAGIVGGPDRHEFTVMGDGVNLAARLAASAPNGAVLTDRATRDAAGQWRLVPGPVLQLKGVRGPVATSRLTSDGAMAGATPADSIVQHPTAMEQACRLWDESGSEAIRIDAFPSTDSRSFVAQMLSKLQLDANATAHFRFIPDDGLHPHGGLQRFLLWAAGVQTGTELLARPGLWSDMGVTSHFALLFGPENRLAGAMARDGVDAWIQKTAEISAQSGLLASMRDRHEVIVFEQVQYLSDVDHQILEKLASSRGRRPRFILVRQCPGPAPDKGDDRVITLGRISRREMQSYLEQLLPGGVPSAQLLDWLYQRAGGLAPLARLCLDHLQRHDQVVRRSGKRDLWHMRDILSTELPDVLRAHNLQRIDRLSRDAGLVARALAVLGDGASHAALACVCEPIMESRALTAGLETLLEQRIIEYTAGSDRDSLAFADENCRRAIYDTLSFAVRECWHRRAAGYWRRRDGAGSVAAAEHLFCARDPSCVAVLVRSAERARRLWLLDRAQHLYRWALLALAGRCDPGYSRVLPPMPRELDRQFQRLLIPYAGVLQIQGRYADARRIHQLLALDAARRRQPSQQSENLLAAARIEWLSGRYPQALRLTARVLRLQNGCASGRLVAQANLLSGEIARRTGKMSHAQQALERAVSLFAKSKDIGDQADALNALGLVHWSCGRIDDAQESFKAAWHFSRIATRTKDPAKRGQIANNLGILMEERGRLRSAERYYRKAFSIFDRLGHRRNRAYSLGNLANLYRHGARYEHARAAYEDVGLELASIGEQHAAAYTIGNRGDLLRDFGDFTGAMELYQRALQFARQVGDAGLIAESYCRFAEVHCATQRYGLAARFATQAASAAAKAGSREFAIRAGVIKACVNAEIENGAAVREAFRKIEQDSTEAGLILYRLWSQFGIGQSLLREGRVHEAICLARRGLAGAKRSGYTWWELRFAVLGAQLELQPGVPGFGRQTYAAKAHALKAVIEAGIGDPAVRITFAQLPLVRSIPAFSEDHVVLSQGNSATL